MIKKIVGWLMLIVWFVSLFIFVAINMGIIGALSVFGVTIGIIVFFGIAVHLIF